MNWKKSEFPRLHHLSVVPLDPDAAVPEVSSRDFDTARFIEQVRIPPATKAPPYLVRRIEARLRFEVEHLPVAGNRVPLSGVFRVFRRLLPIAALFLLLFLLVPGTFSVTDSPIEGKRPGVGGRALRSTALRDRVRQVPQRPRSVDLPTAEARAPHSPFPQEASARTGASLLERRRSTARHRSPAHQRSLGKPRSPSLEALPSSFSPDPSRSAQRKFGK
ncbi:MAG: hypothetical protein D6812_13020 [Deltaproteobacteria bacterium]|nr:MAG: hypothetical protein D6812_13020 [Deltaproteobacteria bacterium]